jgi:hypothetical protein
MPYYTSGAADIGGIHGYAGNVATRSMGNLYRGGPAIPNLSGYNTTVPTAGAISLDNFRNANIWTQRAYPGSVYTTVVDLGIGAIDLGKAGYWRGYDSAVLGGTGYSFGSFNGLSGQGPNYNGPPTYPTNCPWFTTPAGTWTLRCLTHYGGSTTVRIVLTGTSGYPPDNDFSFIGLTVTNVAGNVTYVNTSRAARTRVYSYPYWYYRTEFDLPLAAQFPTSGTLRVNFRYYG